MTYGSSGFGTDLGEWAAFYKGHDIPHNVAGLPISRKTIRDSHLLVVPQLLGVDLPAKLISAELAKYGISSSLSSVTIDGHVFALSSLVATNDTRSPADWYTRWIPNDFMGRDTLARRASIRPELDMTLLEALWNSLFMLQKYKGEYIAINDDISRPCGRTRGGIPGGARDKTPSIEWDVAAEASVWLQWN